MNRPEYIVIHHSLTKDGLIVDWDAIRRYHKSFRYQGNIVSPEEAAVLRKNGHNVESPWTDIGYHYGVERVKGELTTQMGRRVDLEGAHAKEMGMNSKSIGICVVGNFDVVPPDALTVNYLRDLIYALMANYPITSNRVIGHRDVGLMAGLDWTKIGAGGVREFKTCPGIMFPMHGLQIELKGGLV